MAKSDHPRIHSPAFWEDAADRNRHEFDPFRGADPATWTEAQRTHYMVVCARQIERLFFVVEAIALELPEPKPPRQRITRTREPRDPKPSARQELNRLGSFLVEHYPDEANGNAVDAAIRLLSTEEQPDVVAQKVDDGRDES